MGIRSYLSKFIFKKHILESSLSDNQVYPDLCKNAFDDYDIFKNFRRNAIYNQIIEHVTEEQGHDYLKEISKNKDIYRSMPSFKLNDEVGNPKVYEYSGVGLISPTTLRYIKVLSDLMSLYGSLNGLRICEIGVGYGGQCRIINSHYEPTSYLLVDLQPVLDLSHKYLKNFIIEGQLYFKTMDELPVESYDLVISNYAFSELTRDIQDVYLQKVLLNSKKGYITYNDITPKEYRTYTANQMLNIIPGSIKLEEKPLTHPKNCIIVWGHNDIVA